MERARFRECGAEEDERGITDMLGPSFSLEEREEAKEEGEVKD